MGKTILLYGSILVLLVLTTAFFQYFFQAKHIRKKKEYFAQLHQKMQVGNQVILMDGVYGTLLRVGIETVDVKVKSGEVMEVSRFAITEIVPDKKEAL
ncbi:preprotein translocase subunit YajC [Enterococcus caccae]|uniref:Preprotein translocase, YajC subunit n=1 Tax=Enterococcus caccae ATCC BAA-1240 TaxID=1158612 RepID=R3W7X7_9ENTE|nr:preprotein translocase subunit YajC [Enterococcus caccae]EOL43602.1 preprotein translocase, YajC subunit [Enterococcus caccae ATCC BAA-1240]EOT67998.1 preprotein translocase, YajC subunit [Enterococcus caccae ATCC BAA-1240]OJG28513.1 preprotein translocase, YajC subunit [Enterococcus caccae]